MVRVEVPGELHQVNVDEGRLGGKAAGGSNAAR
jgi:hypothetical protein